jgi:tetratricopeptide (TPR) repeat protein
MSAEGSLMRHVVAGALALCVLALGIPATRWVMADRLATSAPDKALRWVPEHPVALESAAASALDAGDDAASESLAKRAMARRPVEARPYRILAAIYERSERLADARAAHLAAIAVSPSDAVARLWIASRLLVEMRYADALRHIDRALRARPDLHAVVFPVLAGGLQNPGFLDALVGSLLQSPPWRKELLSYLTRHSASIDPVLPLFEALAESNQFADGELRLLTGGLERERRWDDLVAVWRRFEPASYADGSFIVDGAFERDPHGFGLGWRIGRIAGAIIGFAPARGSANGGRAMVIRFLDQRVPFAHVEQRLLLPAGRFRFSGESRADGLRTRRGLRWELACDGRNELLASSPLVVGAQDWRAWTVDLDIPRDCGSQWLRLRLAAVGPSEQLVGGQAAFDGLRIEPLPSGEESDARAAAADNRNTD